MASSKAKIVFYNFAKRISYMNSYKMITIVLENFGILGFSIPVVTDLIFPFWVEDFYKIFNRIKIMEGNTLVFTLNWKLFFFCNTDVVKASTFLNLLFWLPSSALSFFEIFEKSSIIQFQIKDYSNTPIEFSPHVQ